MVCRRSVVCRSIFVSSSFMCLTGGDGIHPETIQHNQRPTLRNHCGFLFPVCDLLPGFLRDGETVRMFGMHIFGGWAMGRRCLPLFAFPLVASGLTAEAIQGGVRESGSAANVLLKFSSGRSRCFTLGRQTHSALFPIIHAFFAGDSSGLQ